MYQSVSENYTLYPFHINPATFPLFVSSSPLSVALAVHFQDSFTERSAAMLKDTNRSFYVMVTLEKQTSKQAYKQDLRTNPHQ